ncbi:MAG: hypothetical protein ABIV28_05210 [Longimicrobiales bacterium]
MPKIRTTLLTAALLNVAWMQPVLAQEAMHSTNVQVTDSIKAQTLRAHSPLVRVSKWSALAFSVGTAAYGFAQNRAADRDYLALEKRCVANEVNCNRRSGEAYIDAEMEAMYQKVRSLDNRARTALLASQVGIVTTVGLFIYDLRDNRPAKDIPYKPRPVEVVPRGDGSVHLRVTLPLRRTR